MRNKKWKHPNAYKHGIFAATAILPGEDEREFEELHSALIEEWMPAGATEEDAVLSIAKAVWRKRRLQRFLEVQFRMNAADPNHPSYRETPGLSCLATVMQLEPETAFQEYANRFLQLDRIRYLEQKFPRSNFKSTSEWANAVLGELKSLLLVPELVNEQMVNLHHSAANVSGDLFKQELALDERLDAMIDRAVKRLAQTKAMKQMLGHMSAERAHDRPRKIVAKKTPTNNG